MQDRVRLPPRLLLALLPALTICAGLAVAGAPAASAHPLGNFTVNYYTELRIEPNTVVIDLVVDRAEIPTLQAFPNAVAGQQPEGAVAWSGRECAELASQTTLRRGDAALALRSTASVVRLLPGTAGLPTSRLECSIRTVEARDMIGQSLSYQAAPTAGRVGWHEVTARGDGVVLVGSDVPQASVSKQLTAYPQDLLSSPLDQRNAQFSVRQGSGIVATEGATGPLSSSPWRGLDRFSSAYTNLVTRTTLTPWFALFAIAVSMLLGGLHAFAPGHGKTLMAAYLVGREGTWRQAAVIGLSVTITHTLGVLLLGAVLTAALVAAPEAVYPWLGLTSGLLLAGIGISLLRAARATSPHDHAHGHDGHHHPPDTPSYLDATPGRKHDRDSAAMLSEVSMAATRHPSHTHAATTPAIHQVNEGVGQSHHHPHPHPHAHSAAHQTVPHSRSTLRLAVVGLAGGLVPSPSALLVLLGGIALGRAWFGVVLVFFYGLGMATALVLTGLLLVLARDRFEAWSAAPGRRRLPGQTLANQVVTALPTLTALAVIAVGTWIALRSLTTIG